MRRLVYLSSARDDLADILRFITRESGSAAVASLFVGKVRHRCERLASLPGTLGSARPDLREDLRSVPCHGYVIFFRYDPGMIEIVNVLHASRDILAYFDEE